MPAPAGRKICFVIPELYHRCLLWMGLRDGLPPCSFRRAQLNQIAALENLLGAAVPSEYASHLLNLGWGEEHGGLARWLHLDFARGDHIISCNRRWEEAGKPENFLAVYDSLEGVLFGYLLPLSATAIYLWDSDGGGIEKHTDSIGEFYRERLDCSEEEISAIASGQVEKLPVPGSQSLSKAPE